jgi:hypothetical protein
MAILGRYCKAYSVARFREFGGWHENTKNLRSGTGQADEAQEGERRSLSADDFLYLQVNFVVTDGIFIDEHITFLTTCLRSGSTSARTRSGLSRPLYEAVRACGPAQAEASD